MPATFTAIASPTATSHLVTTARHAWSATTLSPAAAAGSAQLHNVRQGDKETESIASCFLVSLSPGLLQVPFGHHVRHIRHALLLDSIGEHDILGVRPGQRRVRTGAAAVREHLCRQ